MISNTKIDDPKYQITKKVIRHNMYYPNSIFVFFLCTRAYQHSRKQVERKLVDDDVDARGTDLCEILSDRIQSLQVTRGEDGDDDATVQAIYSQDAFGSFIVGMLHDMYSNSRYPHVEHLSCHTGAHRAHTAGKTLAAAANALVDENGDRVFNCQHWATHKLWKRDAVNDAVMQAGKWVSDPWTDVEGGIGERCYRYAYQAAMRRETSAGQFKVIWDAVDVMNDRAEFTETSFVETPPSVAESFTPPQPPTPPRPMRKRSIAMPQEVRQTRARISADVVEVLRERDEVRRMERQFARARDDRESELREDREERAIEKARWHREEHESWQQVGDNVDLADAWTSTLNELGVDEPAQRELFLLGQANSTTRSAAAGVIAKLLKKSTDGETYRTSISAFVHSSVLKVWHTVNWR
jgi:hypothetical protein